MTPLNKMFVLGTILTFVVAGCMFASAADTSEAPAVTQDTTVETTAASSILAGVCPDPVVIPTDWFPQSEHGVLYNLIGDDYTIDTNRKVVVGSLVSADRDTGIDIKVRTGGPAIGFQLPLQQMYVETDILLQPASKSMSRIPTRVPTVPRLHVGKST